jgi:cellulose biosynthesis protein BcsQ
MIAAPGRITTFYSYKGGTGRSMALANFAWLLAVSGKRVLAIDWDLEAPGLHRYFRPFLVDNDLVETDGLIDAFWQFAASALTNASSGGRSSSSDQETEVSEALEDSTRRLEWDFPSGGYIDFIGAGRQGATYSERVNTFDWKRFYELGGARLLARAKDYMRKEYQWVLIDSRTGVSDTSGICTVQMPDSVVACFTMNRQSVDGVTAILRSIRAYRSPTVDGSTIEFFPIAMRIEDGESDRLEIARAYARNLLADFLPRRADASNRDASNRDYWDSMEISYWKKYAFEEILAGFGDATGLYGAKDTMLGQVEEMSKLITGDANLRAPEVLEEDRAKVLAKYALGTKRIKPLEQTSTANSAPGVATDAEFRRIVLAKEQQWRSSGFRLSLLLSRRELDLLTEDDRKMFGRDAAYYVVQSYSMQHLLRILEIGGTTIFTLVVGLFAFFSWVGYYDPWRVAYSFPIAVLAWMFLALAYSTFVGLEKVYGVRVPEVFILCLRGVFRPEIRDYDPDVPTVRK